MPAPDLDATFVRLRQLLEQNLSLASVKADEPGSLYLEMPNTARPEMFAAVATKKAYVSFHYMPVYVDPGLLDGLAPELRRRMQGKSCFNFRRPDDPGIAELEKLVEATAGSYLTPDR